MISIKPISVNICWQGRRFATPAYKQWREEMLLRMDKRRTIKGKVRIKITLVLKSILRSDLDNYLKPIIDCIVKKGWIEDDRYIQLIEAEKIQGDEEGIEISIQSIL